MVNKITLEEVAVIGEGLVGAGIAEDGTYDCDVVGGYFGANKHEREERNKEEDEC